MRILGFIFNTIFLLIMLSVAGLFLLPYLPFDHGIELRIVESGSMEPAIMTGSLIMVRPHDAYNVGDVIMFDSPQTRVPTTHRILEIAEENGRTHFITKGDANEEADPGVVYERQVFGTVAFAVPRAGFVLDFARQPIGFIFLIVLPALLIVFGEIEKIWREIRARRKNAGDNESDGAPFEEKVLQPVAQEMVQKAPPRSMMDIATPVRRFELPTLDLRRMTPYKSASSGKRRMFTRHVATLSTIVFSVLVFSSSFLGSTVSYFNDTELSIDNFLGAIALDVAAVPDGEVYNFLGDAIDDLDGAVVVTVSPESGSAAVHYDITTNVIGSSTPLCSAVVADAAAPVSVTSSLPLLSASDVTFNAPWEIAFSLPDETGLSSADICSVEIVLTAWHFDEALGEGYYDTETVPLTFTYTAPITIESFAPLTGNSLSASIENAMNSVSPGSELSGKVSDMLDLVGGMGQSFIGGQEIDTSEEENIGEQAEEEQSDLSEPEIPEKEEVVAEAEGVEETPEEIVKEESSILSESGSGTKEDKEVTEPEEDEGEEPEASAADTSQEDAVE